MGYLVHALVLIGGHADDVKHQRSFCFGAHHAVHGGQLADPIGCRKHRRAPNARVAIRGVRRIQLVGAADPLHLRAAVHRIADRKQVVASNAKAVIDALRGEALDDVIGDADRLRLS